MLTAMTISDESQGCRTKASNMHVPDDHRKRAGAVTSSQSTKSVLTSSPRDDEGNHSDQKG